MERLFLIAALFLLPSAWAQEIQVNKPILFGKAPVKVKKYDAAAKSWNEVDGFGYSFIVYLKNISDRPLTVVTDGLSQQSSSGASKQDVKLDMAKMSLVDDDALLIPSREDLRLVDIRPGEAAALKIEFKMAVPLEELTVTYNPEDFYDGRFGYWTGKVSSEPLILENREK